MQLDIPRDRLIQLVGKQLDNLFMFDPATEGSMLEAAIDSALDKCDFCFSHTTNKYYRRNGETYFNPFHSGQYSIFLYFASHAVFALSPESKTLADRLYYLNKALNGLDLYYEVAMPAIFALDHSVGAVMGRATYGDYFFFSQNCAVGNNKGVYPRIGRHVRMMSGATLIGRCQVGDHVVLAAKAYVKDTDIPSCSLVFGSSPDLVIKARPESYFKAFEE